MAIFQHDTEHNAQAYANTRGLSLVNSIGQGVHGTVFLTNVPTAVKAHYHEESYRRERDCYNLLRKENVTRVCGHNVPQFLGCDDTLMVLEMTVVTPPYVLDFASAYLDWPPEFPPEVWEDWYQQKCDQFGNNWAAVERIIAALRDGYGIFMIDLNPGNIRFA